MAVESQSKIKGNTMKIAEILKDSDYKLEIFSEEAIKNLEARITNKHNRGD